MILFYRILIKKLLEINVKEIISLFKLVKFWEQTANWFLAAQKRKLNIPYSQPVFDIRTPHRHLNWLRMSAP